MAGYHNLKDYYKEQKLHTNRANTAIVFILIAFAILFFHLFRLQVVEYETYNTFSKNNRINLLPISPNRGLIYDRNGVILAENKPIYQLEINLKQIKNLKQTIKDINEVIPITETDEQRFYDLHKRNWRRAGLPIKTNLTEEEMALFAVNRHNFPGIEMTAKLIRYYPFKDQLVHILGYVGRINDDEYEIIDQDNYAGTQYIGKMGIEKFYEDLLHGKVGRQEVEINARGRINKVLRQQLPQAGDELYLTIDVNLQKVATEALKDKRAALVAIDPRNGEILALVSTPGYDPNMFVEGIPTTEYKKLQVDEDKPLFNRALRGQYPPGSTVKPLLAMGGLVNGAINVNSSLYDPGHYTIPGESHVYQDWMMHGHVDLRTSIVNSCNVFYYTLAHKLGIDNLEYTFKQFGYGTKTNVDISDELPGLVPSRAWKKKTRGGVWLPGETIITGIGQGYLGITPMQLAQAASIIALRGKHAAPHLLLQRKDNNSEFIIHKPVIADTVYSGYDQYWDKIHDGMAGVITEGTARSIRYPESYTIAGKTGTSQVVKLGRDSNKRLRNHKLFMAFAPVENPRIAVGVIVENGANLVPLPHQIARKVMDYYLLQSGDVKPEELKFNKPVAAPATKTNLEQQEIQNANEPTTIND